MGAYGRYITCGGAALGFYVKVPGTKPAYFSPGCYAEAVCYRDRLMVKKGIRHIDYISVYFGIVPDRDKASKLPLGIRTYVSRTGNRVYTAAAQGILSNGHTGRVSKSLTLTGERTFEGILATLLEWRTDMECRYARGRQGFYK